MSGGGVDDIDRERFDDYDSAFKYACSLEECMPTIYLILNDKYCYYCKRSAVENEPYVVYNINETDFGYIETRIWYSEFIKNPQEYIKYCVGTITKEK